MATILKRTMFTPDCSSHAQSPGPNHELLHILAQCKFQFFERDQVNASFYEGFSRKNVYQASERADIPLQWDTGRAISNSFTLTLRTTKLYCH